MNVSRNGKVAESDLVDSKMNNQAQPTVMAKDNSELEADRQKKNETHQTALHSCFPSIEPVVQTDDPETNGKVKTKDYDGRQGEGQEGGRREGGGQEEGGKEEGGQETGGREGGGLGGKEESPGLQDGLNNSQNHSAELSINRTSASLYIISLDLESTGLNMNTALGDQCDSICQIAVDVQEIEIQPKTLDSSSSSIETDGLTGQSPCPSTLVRWTPVGQFEKLIKPLKTMSKGAADVTGITDDKLAGCKPLPEVFDELQKYLETVCRPGHHRVLMAYNGLKFDFKMIFIDLMRSLEKHCPQNPDPVKWLRKLKVDWLFDPLVLARSSLERSTLIHNSRGNCSFKLGDLYESMYGKKLENAHDALADCIAVNDVLKHSLFAPHFKSVVSQVIETEGPAETDALKSPMKYFKEVAKIVDQKKTLPSVKEQISAKLKRLRNLKRKAPVNNTEESVEPPRVKQQKT